MYIHIYICIYLYIYQQRSTTNKGQCVATFKTKTCPMVPQSTKMVSNYARSAHCRIYLLPKCAFRHKRITLRFLSDKIVCPVYMTNVRQHRSGNLIYAVRLEGSMS